MQKLSIILSFDYELPLGGCRSFEKALFEPTDALLALANRLEVPIVLFADACSALRFKEWDAETYYEPFVRQLQASIDALIDEAVEWHGSERLTDDVAVVAMEVR